MVSGAHSIALRLVIHIEIQIQVPARKTEHVQILVRMLVYKLSFRSYSAYATSAVCWVNELDRLLVCWPAYSLVCSVGLVCWFVSFLAFFFGDSTYYFHVLVSGFMHLLHLRRSHRMM